MAPLLYHINLYTQVPEEDLAVDLAGLEAQAEVRTSSIERFGPLQLLYAAVEVPATASIEEYLLDPLRARLEGRAIALACQAFQGGEAMTTATLLSPELTPERVGTVIEALHAEEQIIQTVRILSETFRAVEMRVCGAPREPAALTQRLLPTAEEAHLDLAIQPLRQYGWQGGWLVMDMDSTFLSVECIDELAAHAGLSDEIAKITAQAMQGELDFRDSLIARTQRLQGVSREVLEAVYQERVRLNPGARRLIPTLHGLGMRFALVSGGFTYYTRRLEAEFGIDHSVANELEIEDGHLTGRIRGEVVDGEVKAATVRWLRERDGLERDQLVAVGDGANDLPMLREAGMGIAYHAKAKVREKVPYQLRFSPLDGLLYLLGLSDVEIARLASLGETTG